MNKQKKDRISCWQIALLSPLLFYLHYRWSQTGLSSHSSVMLLTLATVLLMFLRSYHLDENGITAKYLFVRHLFLPRW